jgi:hypothetical protein
MGPATRCRSVSGTAPPFPKKTTTLQGSGRQGGSGFARTPIRSASLCPSVKTGPGPRGSEPRESSYRSSGDVRKEAAQGLNVFPASSVLLAAPRAAEPPQLLELRRLLRRGESQKMSNASAANISDVRTMKPIQSPTIASQTKPPTPNGTNSASMGRKPGFTIRRLRRLPRATFTRGL